MTDSETKPIHARRGKRKIPADSVRPKQIAVIERNLISPNWQNFLKTQTKMEKKPKEDNVKQIDKDISAYWKTKRLEKKANLKEVTSPSQHLKQLNIGNEQKQNSEAKRTLFENPSNIEEVVQNNSYWKNKRMQKKRGNLTAVPAKAAARVEEIDPSLVFEYKPEPVEVDKKLTKYVAIDCEMVGIGDNGRESMLARVSLVNKFGDCIYDKYVKPREKVTDYRTPVSGIRKEDMLNGEEFSVVQNEVAEILRGRFLVGHAVRKDLEVLLLSHPKRRQRDTSKYKPFRRLTMGSTPSLKRLAQELLGVNIQTGEHSSVEDARATMQLYCLHHAHWEASLKARDYKRN